MRPLARFFSKRLLGIALCLLLAGAVYLGWGPNQGRVSVASGSVLLILGLIFLVLYGVQVRHNRRPYQRYLQGLCMHCGYDLRGQTEARCSECGTEFESLRDS